MPIIPTRSNGQTIDETWFNLLNDEVVALKAVDTLALTGLQIPFEVSGDYSHAASKTGVMHYRVTQDLTLLSATLHCVTAGSAGSTQVDVQRKRAAGSFVTIFTTKPSVPFGAGAHANSNTGTGATAAVLASVTDALLIGDILRFDFSAVQTAGIGALLSLVARPTGA